jgi:predicted lactoylglutathione lyase
VNKQVIINLPVADLSKSVAFFHALGYSSHAQFGDYDCARILISDTISLLLLTHVRFRDFTSNSVCDTNKASEVLLWLSCESRQEVDYLVARAIAAGGATCDEPDDYGFVYTRRFVDPDGHGWGLVHSPAAA